MNPADLDDSEIQDYLNHLLEYGPGTRETFHLLTLILWELRALRQRQERTDANLEAVFRPSTVEE